jgi:hypothetical protein
MKKKIQSYTRKLDRYQTHAKTISIRTLHLGAFLWLLSIGAWFYYFNNDLTLSYNDARSHLNIARRVVDSLQPGFAQIGSVWLPLSHVLSIPLVWNDFLFRTGLAGSIISMVGFVFTGIFIFKTVKVAGFDNLAASIALLVFALNPNMLFMQATPMTESLMLATSMGAIYYIVKWAKFAKMHDLILSGVYTFLAMLTRYDGWFLFGMLCMIIPVISYFRANRKKAEAHLIMFGLIGSLAVAIWLGWNWVIFKDPFFFLDGPFSAKAQQDVLLREGRLFTKYNLPFSTYTYMLAVIENATLILSALGIIGFVKALISVKNWGVRLALLSLLFSIFFNILSLVLGISVIHLPQLPPFTWFNDRYGLMTLPLIAFGVGVLVNKRMLAALLMTAVFATQYTTMYLTNNVITIQDGVRGSSGYFLDDIGYWMKQNIKEGNILVAASSHDALIFISGLPLNRFITEGTGKYWNESLETPTKHAAYIVMHEGDLVYETIKDKPDFKNNYHLVYRGKFSDVYKRK